MKRSSFFPCGMLACFVLVLAGSGCGGGKSDKIQIHGKVTLDGDAVPNGMISFIPADGNGATAGGVIKDGEYTAEVPPGSMKVIIRASKVVGQKLAYNVPGGGGPKVDITKEMIPSEYTEPNTTTLKADVTADTRELDFPLSKKK